MERPEKPRRQPKAAAKPAKSPPRAASGFQTGIKRADYVSAFARGLEILRLFDHETERVSVSSAAARTGLSRAAARRFLLTLHELGYSYVFTWRTQERITPYLREGVKAMPYPGPGADAGLEPGGR